MEISMVQTFRGVHSALVTPFDEQDRVDEGALAALVDDQIGAGLHGLAVNGSTGEFASLTPDERRRTVEVVTAAAAGRVPVTVQVGAMTTRESVSLAEHAAASGAACLLLVAPYYEPLGEDEVVDHFSAVAEVGPPVMIYNNPSGTGWTMSPELIARLAEHDNIRFLKDTTGDARRLFRIRGGVPARRVPVLRAARRGRDRRPLLCGGRGRSAGDDLQQPLRHRLVDEPRAHRPARRARQHPVPQGHHR
jgi:dihydrodipicolinate synthase/N-acetylneuraminate lyase